MIRMLDAEGYPKAFDRVGIFKLEFSSGPHKLWTEFTLMLKLLMKDYNERF